MDSFLADVDFSSLRIDPISYDIPVSSLKESTGEHKFSLPSWASCPGPTNGAVVHEIRNGRNYKIHDLDKQNVMYYIFGRSPKVVDERGLPITILNNNASRSHFAIVHSKYDVMYLIDLGSVHGTYIGGKKASRYQPIQLANGKVISIGGCAFKYVVRIFPKKPGENVPFSGFTLSKDVHEFDDDTTFNTHLNQVPDILSPRGQHLIKPISVVNMKTSLFTPVPLNATRSTSSSSSLDPGMLRKPLTMFDLKLGFDEQQKSSMMKRSSSFGLRQEHVATSTLDSRDIRMSDSQVHGDMEVEGDEENNIQVEKIDITKPFHLGLSKKPSCAGILKKQKSIRFGNIMKMSTFNPNTTTSFRKVSFCESKIQLSRNKQGLNPLKSSLRIERKPTEIRTSSKDREVSTLNDTLSISSEEGDEEIDVIEAFDPTRDLPDTAIDLGLINKESKNAILRTYSVKNVRCRSSDSERERDENDGHEKIPFAFPSLNEIRRRGEGFENASPISRQHKIKRPKSERNLWFG